MPRIIRRIACTFLVVAASAGVLLVPLVAGFSAGTVEAATGADRWSKDEKAVLESMTLAKLPAPPTDPSNSVESRLEAVDLGKRLFGDARLSRNGQVSCASCHAPDRQFQDGLPVGKGVGTGSRRTMPIAGTAHSKWFFWDGRKDSLWSQALGPLEDGGEHGGNRLQFARVLHQHYRHDYEALFGPLPDLAGLPEDATPAGDAQLRAAWSGIPAARRDDVNRVFANLGKAIAAYERTIQYGESRFDRYVQAALAGDTAGLKVLSRQEVNGLRLFIGKAQCATCHNGPLMTDQAFHNTGVPARDSARADRGRALATAKVQADEFNCLGRHSDAKPEACAELQFMATDDPGLLGAFKTPSLRNVALRPPYMHAGQFSTLEEVVAHYVRSPAAAVGHSELAHEGKGHAERLRIRLTAEEIGDVAAFLGSLSGPVVEGIKAVDESNHVEAR